MAELKIILQNEKVLKLSEIQKYTRYQTTEAATNSILFYLYFKQLYILFTCNSINLCYLYFSFICFTLNLRILLENDNSNRVSQKILIDVKCELLQIKFHDLFRLFYLI